ncbi:MAG: DEAD/DEAH box helicase [Pirellulales bacterium]|nr:DEAD/DEAH box helicase [Pirellulales bacterium]
MNTTLELLPGTEVHVRGLRWEVVSSESLGPQALFRLHGLENAVLGQELDVLYPFEAIEPVIHDLRPDRAAPLTNWLVYHQAFLLEQALGPHALLAVQPGRLRIEPYQLVPVLRAIRMSRVRLFLCDGVGLGKTVQAGLVLTELIARRLAHRILVVSPAGPLLEQWKTEMSQRFGLRLEVIDRAKLDEIRRSTELGSNPFDHIPLGLVSVDFLKQERALELLDRASYDAVVIDEAHHCMDLGGGQDREDSQRRRLAEVLARRCDSLLLLTATPHDGNDRSFASLCELLDPSLVDGRGTLRGDRYGPHVVRRLKKHVTCFARHAVACSQHRSPTRPPPVGAARRRVAESMMSSAMRTAAQDGEVRRNRWRSAPARAWIHLGESKNCEQAAWQMAVN